MEFTELELVAVSKIGMEMALADGVFDQRENDFFTDVMMAFGLTAYDGMRFGQAASKMSNAEMIKIISSLTEDKKRFVSDFLIRMMHSDGKIDPSEIKLLTMVSHLCGLPV